jgi:hypothetical protein
LSALLFLLPRTPVIGLGTNKVASFVGTSTAAGRYLRRTKVEWRSAAPMAAVALVGSLLGAHAASLMPAAVLESIVLAAMFGIGIYLWRNKTLGVVETLRFDGAVRIGVMAAGGLVIGFWDGMAGPGTGALLVFAPDGQVAWGLAAAMALCNQSGALIGTALATTRGSTCIRKVLFGVVSLLIVSLAGKLALG